MDRRRRTYRSSAALLAQELRRQANEVVAADRHNLTERSRKDISTRSARQRRGRKDADRQTYVGEDRVLVVRDVAREATARERDGRRRPLAKLVDERAEVVR